MSGLEIWKKKLKACQHVLVQFINYRTSHFTFVAKTRRLAKWTRITNARGKGVKLLFFVLEYANFFFDPTVVMVQQDSRANSYDILMLTREFLDMLNAQWEVLVGVITKTSRDQWSKGRCQKHFSPNSWPFQAICAPIIVLVSKIVCGHGLFVFAPLYPGFHRTEFFLAMQFFYQFLWTILVLLENLQVSIPC